jgi:uncharacterized protein Yka (UPF0111/DUF47 family)
MSDFDYTEYPDETLRNVLTNCSWNLKDTKRQIKLLEKRLAGRRGYSHEQLDNMADHLRSAENMITVLETEIDEVKSELLSRIDWEETANV